VQLDLWIKAQKNYKEMTLQWNNTSKINTAIYFQFYIESENDHPLEIRRLPDTCPIFAFMLDKKNPIVEIHGLGSEIQPFFVKPHITYFCFKPLSINYFRDGIIPFSKIVNTHFIIDYISFPVLESLALCQTFEGRINLMNEYLNKHLINMQYQYTLAEFFSWSIHRTKGAIDIKQLADDAGYSPQFCRAKFREVYGISPKKYCEITRLQYAMSKMSYPDLSFSQIALESGYYDHSHFINDFRYYLNETPVKFANRLSDYYKHKLNKNNAYIGDDAV
jgi:AraC-like DNA-binding protein